MTMFTAILSLSVLCFVASVQCYGGDGHNFLAKYIEAQRSRRVSTFGNEVVLEAEYTSVFIGPQDGLKDANKIESLPGQPDGVPFDQYSGYVTVDPVAGRALFYYFTESQNSSADKPLVLWLDGGCSALGGGALVELGPFKVNSDGKSLSYNQYAWNIEANILFLEFPAGVGFSYSNTTSDYVTGDKKTAEDTYTFLINWLERFPEYKTRDFFITGEIYAGHFAPQLAQLILHNNKITNQTVINLKGIAIGNAVLDDEILERGSFDYYLSHALISDEVYKGVTLNCNFTASSANFSDVCLAFINQVDLGDINPLDIYGPVCGSSSDSPSTSGYDPCIDNYVHNYLNTQLVQTSLHVTVPSVGWSSCSNSTWTDSPATVLPIIKELMNSGIRVWLYSGDTDAVIPVTTTRYAIKNLQTSVKTPWFPWYSHAEVGGYAEVYENLTLVTVRGSGLLVPYNQPSRALCLFASFLAGEIPLSKKK